LSSPYFLDKNLSGNLVSGTCGMDAAVSKEGGQKKSLRTKTYSTFSTSWLKNSTEFSAWHVSAQGIEAVSFFAGGKKDTSVKPGPRARGARMRPG
jgi:hypothetical protein